MKVRSTPGKFDQTWISDFSEANLGLSAILEYLVCSRVRASLETAESTPLLSSFRRMLRGVCDGEVLLDQQLKVQGKAEAPAMLGTLLERCFFEFTFGKRGEDILRKYLWKEDDIVGEKIIGNSVEKMQGFAETLG